MTILSLIANSLLLYVGGASPAFFLLPTRAWELGMGATIALLPAYAFANLRGSQAWSLIGLALVAFGMIAGVGRYAWIPDAVPVAIGTTVLLICGSQGRPYGDSALSVRVVTGIGLISYSLYLWHWPILVFARYYLIRDLTIAESLAAMVLMFVAAYGSWRFIEAPYRARSMPARSVLLQTGIGAAALAVTGVVFVAAAGLPARLDPAVAIVNASVDSLYKCPVFRYLTFGVGRACEMNLPSRVPVDADVVLLGNSHALMYAPLVASTISPLGLHGILVSVNSCLPTVSANISAACRSVAARNLDEINKLPHASRIFIGLTWNYPADGLIDPDGKFLDNSQDAALIRGLDDLIKKLGAGGVGRSNHFSYRADR